MPVRPGSLPEAESAGGCRGPVRLYSRRRSPGTRRCRGLSKERRRTGASGPAAPTPSPPGAPGQHLPKCRRSAAGGARPGRGTSGRRDSHTGPRPAVRWRAVPGPAHPPSLGPRNRFAEPSSPPPTVMLCVSVRARHAHGRPTRAPARLYGPYTTTLCSPGTTTAPGWATAVAFGLPGGRGAGAAGQRRPGAHRSCDRQPPWRPGETAGAPSRRCHRFSSCRVTSLWAHYAGSGSDSVLLPVAAERSHAGPAGRLGVFVAFHP
jgi:hypothetical protein